MIASNYRKHPDAMALQLPLPFPHRLIWHTARPGVRILRTIRAARAAAFKAAGRIAYPIKRAVPAWWTDARRNARRLAGAVRDACMVLVAEVRVAISTTETSLIGFNYEDDLARKALREKQPRIVRRICWNCGDTATSQRLTHLGNCRCLTCGCRSEIGPDNDPDDADPT